MKEKTKKGQREESMTRLRRGRGIRRMDNKRKKKIIIRLSKRENVYHIKICMKNLDQQRFTYEAYDRQSKKKEI
jgi:hypothetical protein